jgi:hypothetical protein
MHGIDSKATTWRDDFRKRNEECTSGFQCRLSDRWNDHLDACHGECVLKRPDFHDLVADSLRKFDQAQYDLTDFVVMPNHVHVLVAFADEQSMLAQCESWKRYTATRINAALGRSGRFWQQDGFDHLGSVS